MDINTLNFYRYGLEVHLPISGTVMSVIRDMVNLLYLLWNNYSSISSIFLVEMPLDYKDTIRTSIPIWR